MQKKNPWSDENEEDEGSDSDMDVISEEVAPREKRERKGDDLIYTCIYSVMFDTSGLLEHIRVICEFHMTRMHLTLELKMKLQWVSFNDITVSV